MRATKAIIHLENLRHNIRLVRKHVGPAPKICMAVKADAYGHGVLKVVQTALSEGVDTLAVATVEEGAELRASGIGAPILLLSPPDPGEVGDLVRAGLAPVVGDLELAGLIESEARGQGRLVSVHLKVDTGMGRIGCKPAEAPGLAERIASSTSLALGGICTHFPVADRRNSRFTADQTLAFRRVVEEVRRRGIQPGTVHAANSGAILEYPEARFDMVRPGILLYGYYPSRDQERTLAVRPVMELETRILFLKRVDPGTAISYGMTYVTTRSTVIATIPVGYGDGYPRLLSSKAEVAIGGKRFPVAGTICMDQCMVDLGPDAAARLYDRVVLFGPEPPAPTAEDIADAIGTIPYEITCGINWRVPRLYTDSGPTGAEAIPAPPIARQD